MSTITVKDSASPPTSAHHSFTVSIGKGSQTVTFTSTPPNPATPGHSYAVTATASSGLAVTFSIDKKTKFGTCSYSSSSKKVLFIHAGTCIVDANQKGNVDYLAAPTVKQSVTIN